MSKSLRSYPERERKAVAQRRVRGNTGGIGYLAAVAYLKRAGEKAEAVKEVELNPTPADMGQFGTNWTNQLILP